MFIRKLKNASGNTVFQVVKKVGRQNRVVKHLGTARNSLEENQLASFGQQYLDRDRLKEGRLSLFDNRYPQTDWEKFFERFTFTQALDSITYNFFKYFYRVLGLTNLKDDLFCDLVVARILWPVSKAKTRDFLEDNLGKVYSLTTLYRKMQLAIKENYQENIEKLLWSYLAKQGETVSVLFFDVTTLYFETSDEDDFRRRGFSKDSKANQPQVTVTLTVTSTGFPLHLRSFTGNKFEGHTIIPCLLEIRKNHNLDDLVVVADSAMLSETNLEALEKNNLKFIVGARLSNLPSVLFKKVVAIVGKTDGATARFTLGDNRILVVSYSQKRAAKDRSDREKQLRRANFALTVPSAVGKHFKFLKKITARSFSLNEDLIEKSKQLEGLKGYITNQSNLTDEEIIGKYAQLWQVEKSFRMSKSDLRARPIFHTVKEKIEAHLLIVFTALAVIRLAEAKAQITCARILETLNPIKEIIIKDQLTGEEISKFVQPQKEAKPLLKLARINWVT